ncbi:hypothetical protein FisN_2Hh303 [Fistulifera solaris]|uniref:Uncharacterized protein n=1 Tax=Fistulifera solaris TaxID=1519565 RepID=A0A1Z5KKN1_FISSO|nr:hypothetical protein FisN_2Hh303 [Fistulifera solaris]|eukprot:GAX26747.1 hypothetical protein FisN_2Hh303 [Fistulifera solaris]
MKLLLLITGCASISAQVAVNGGWSDWVDDGICCGGFIKRVRVCNNPEPAGGGAFCAGPSELPFTCENDQCGSDGWSEWSEYTPCCNLANTRSRTCLSVNANLCVGEATESIPCERTDGSTECYFANVATGACEIPLSIENQTLFETREQCCSTQFAADDFGVCMGDPTAPTPSEPTAPTSGGEEPTSGGSEGEVVVNGGWGEWTEYNTCCENTQSRFRVCDNPKPSENGAPCVGSFREERPCSPNVCGVDTDGGAGASSSAKRLAVPSVAVLVAVTGVIV